MPRRRAEKLAPGAALLSCMAIWLTYPLQKPGIYVKDPMAGFFMVRRSCLREVDCTGKVQDSARDSRPRQCPLRRQIPFTFGPRRAGTSKASLKVGLDYFILLYKLWKAGLGVRS